MANNSPNIVFIMADQLGAKHIRCYGWVPGCTPTLDGLAEHGTRFDRCYATCPVCAPSRASFLTGRSPCVHGVVMNNHMLPPDIPTYAHVLRAHGYRTGGFGKFHQTPMHFPAPENLAFLGFDESLVTEDPKWPWYEWVQREHPQYANTALAMTWDWPTHPHHPQFEMALAAREKLKAPAIKASRWRMMFPSRLPPDVHDTTYITNLGLDFIERHLNEHLDRPFFCHISYVDPHDPYDPPEPYASMFKPGDMPEPLPAEWIADEIQALRRSQSFCGFEKIWNKPDVLRELRALYTGSIRFIDDQIGRIVRFLKESGQWNNTIIVFTTDHGEMLGDHGLITKGVKHYDAGIRCPLIVSGRGINPGVSDHLRCTLDFFPTFCDWAGIPADDIPPLEGRSFAGICRGRLEEKPWSEIWVGFDSAQSVITAGGWRLTLFCDEGKGQMFNLREDPEEQHDLYGINSSAGMKQQLLEALTAASTRSGRIPQYRNMPIMDGKKHLLVNDQMLNSLPIYS